MSRFRREEPEQYSASEQAQSHGYRQDEFQHRLAFSSSQLRPRTLYPMARSGPSKPLHRRRMARKNVPRRLRRARHEGAAIVSYRPPVPHPKAACLRWTGTTCRSRLYLSTARPRERSDSAADRHPLSNRKVEHRAEADPNPDEGESVRGNSAQRAPMWPSHRGHHQARPAARCRRKPAAHPRTAPAPVDRPQERPRSGPQAHQPHNENRTWSLRRLPCLKSQSRVTAEA